MIKRERYSIDQIKLFKKSVSNLILFFSRQIAALIFLMKLEESDESSDGCYPIENHVLGEQGTLNASKGMTW